MREIKDLIEAIAVAIMSIIGGLAALPDRGFAFIDNWLFYWFH